MNKERILELAEHIRQSDSYTQGKWFNECGTPGCIAGHTIALFADDFSHFHFSESGLLTGLYIDTDGYGKFIRYKAMMLLELDENQAHAIFSYLDVGDATKEQAAAMLEWFVQTGIVRWDLIEYNNG